MVLPIIGYGAIVLKTKTKEIPADYPELNKLISDMYETMYDASGVGLAAPQIGKSIRLFVIDTSPFDTDDFEQNSGFEVKSVKKTFINPVMIDESGENASFEEGCLSIPNIREEVYRQSDLYIEYYDEKFEFQKEKLSGITARIVQHEYDHIEGILFTDHLNPLKRRLLKRKLVEISKGVTSAKYKMRFPNQGKKR